MLFKQFTSSDPLQCRVDPWYDLKDSFSTTQTASLLCRYRSFLFSISKSSKRLPITTHDEGFPNQTRVLLEFTADLLNDRLFGGINIFEPEGFNPFPPLFRKGPDCTFISSSGSVVEEDSTGFEDDVSACKTDLSLVNVPPKRTS